MPGPVPPFRRLLDGYREDGKSGCWEWLGNTYNNGYGCLKAFGKTVSAHRLSYELHKGPIPGDLEVLHSCDNRKCINPDHLRVGTHQENMREAAERGRLKGNTNPNPRRGHKSSQSKQVRVLGRVFGSMNQAEKELGLGSGTVRFWLLNKPEKAQEITKEEYLRHAK